MKDLTLLFEQIQDRLRVLKTIGRKHIAIIGSLNTLNTGDIAIMSVVRDLIKRRTGISPVMLSWRYCNTKNFDLIIVCGGDVLHDRSTANLAKLKALLHNTNNVIFLGVGVPGFYLTPIEEVNSLLSKAKMIIVRDTVSGDRLRLIGLTNVIDSFDNAFLLKREVKENISTNINTRTVGINIKEYNSAAVNDIWTTKKKKSIHQTEKFVPKLSLVEYLNNYNRIIKFFINNDWNIKVINFTYADEKFVKQHFSKEHEVVPFTKNFNKLRKTIRSVDVMFCTRYHSLIFSLLEGKPVCGYAYSDKIDNLTAKLEIDSFISREDWSSKQLNRTEFSCVDAEIINYIREKVRIRCKEAISKKTPNSL